MGKVVRNGGPVSIALARNGNQDIRARVRAQQNKGEERRKLVLRSNLHVKFIDDYGINDSFLEAFFFAM